LTIYQLVLNALEVFVLNFQAPQQSAQPDTMTDITDAIESSRTVTLGFERMSLSHWFFGLLTRND